MARQAPVADSTAAPALPARWFLLAILTASYGAGAFGMLGLSPLSPSLVDGFGLTRFQVAFIVPSIYVGGLLFSLPGGRLGDRIGVRPSFLGGLGLGAVGLLAAALSPTLFRLPLLPGVGRVVLLAPGARHAGGLHVAAPVKIETVRRE